MNRDDRMASISSLKEGLSLGCSISRTNEFACERIGSFHAPLDYVPLHLDMPYAVESHGNGETCEGLLIVGLLLLFSPA